MAMTHLRVPIEEIKIAVAKGDCPANNTTCSNLTLFGCKLKYPDLFYRVKENKGLGYACGSYEQKLLH